MRRIKAEAAIIGSGAAAMFAAARLLVQGYAVALINPFHSLNIDDLRPSTGLGLWNAAYRGEGTTSLSVLYETLLTRLREIFPATVDQTGLLRTDSYSILSTTPVHKKMTQDFEREYFKLERKEWTSSQMRLLGPDHIYSFFKRIGVDLSAVAALEGGIQRSYSLWWDAPKMGLYLTQYMASKIKDNSNFSYYSGATIMGNHGRKVVFKDKHGEEHGVEPRDMTLVFLTGDILPRLKHMVAACTESWIQGVRKRRREQHFLWFERQAKSDDEEALWLELGPIKYCWWKSAGFATWFNERGPDGLEHVVDEAFRVQSAPINDMSLSAIKRSFRLEWEWKHPQWRETRHKMHWATSFEGDLWSMMELVWNLPRL